MLAVTAQVSFYPLRQSSLSPSIKAATEVLDAHNIERETGPMSTLMWGEKDLIFKALNEAFSRVAEIGEAVMTVTISNACPWPGEGK